VGTLIKIITMDLYYIDEYGDVHFPSLNNSYESMDIETSTQISLSNISSYGDLSNDFPRPLIIPNYLYDGLQNIILNKIKIISKSYLFITTKLLILKRNFQQACLIDAYGMKNIRSATMDYRCCYDPYQTCHHMQSLFLSFACFKKSIPYKYCKFGYNINQINLKSYHDVQILKISRSLETYKQQNGSRQVSTIINNIYKFVPGNIATLPMF